MTDLTTTPNLTHNTRFLGISRIKTIVTLAVPILATMLSVNLMGVIDTAMIGQLGDAALASVSVGNNLFFMVFSLLMGGSAGVQILVARKLGQGDTRGASTILNAGLLTAAGAGLLLIVICYAVLPPMAGVINRDPAVVAYAQDYLSGVLPSLFFGGAAAAFAGYWLGIQRPVLNLLTVVIQLVCNAFFNYLLIFGHLGLPRLEVLGAGVGTSLANLVALSVNCLILMIITGAKHPWRALPGREQIKTLLMFSIPMGVQQFLFALGMMVFVFIVGLLGTKPLAAFQIVMVIMMTSFLLAIGLGTTSTTLVSSALGQGNRRAASQWGWEIATLGAGLLLVTGIVFAIAAKPIVGLFTVDPETAQLALWPVRIMIISVWLEAFGRILSMALMGAGAVGTVFKITFANQWFLRLPCYWFFGVFLELGLVGIFVTMLVLYLIQTSQFVWIWHGGKWGEDSEPRPEQESGAVEN